MGDAHKVKSQVVLSSGQQGIPLQHWLANRKTTLQETSQPSYTAGDKFCLGLAQEWVPGSQLYPLNQKGSGI